MSRSALKKKKVPIRSLSLPITKSRHELPHILSLPNDALAGNLRKTLKASPVSVLGKKIREITSPSTLLNVGFNFKSIMDHNNLTNIREVKHLNLPYPLTFSQAIVDSSSPSYADTVVKNEQHRLIGRSLRTAILHPHMSREVQHSLLSQISHSAVFVSHIAFTDGYGYDTKGKPGSMPIDVAMELSQLPELATIEVNMPSSYLLKLLSNAFCNVSFISLDGLLPSALMEVLHVVRSRHYRSEQNFKSNAGQTFPSCCKLTELHLSVKVPETSHVSDRRIEVEKIRDFEKVISNNLRCFSTLKRFSLRVTNAPEIIHEIARKLCLRTWSWIVPIGSDIQLLTNGYGKSINHRRKHSPETAHAWFCESITNIHDLCTEAKKGQNVRAIERYICKSLVMECKRSQTLLQYARMRLNERQWVWNVCREYGNSIMELRVSDLQRRTDFGLHEICSFVKCMALHLPNIRGINLHWFVFDHLVNMHGTLHEIDTLKLINTFPRRTQWIQISIKDILTQTSDWKQTFVHNFVKSLPLFLNYIVRHCRNLRSIIVTKQTKQSVTISDPSTLQKAISSVEDIESKHQLLDLSSVRDYLINESIRSR